MPEVRVKILKKLMLEYLYLSGFETNDQTNYSKILIVAGSECAVCIKRDIHETKC